MPVEEQRESVQSILFSTNSNNSQLRALGVQMEGWQPDGWCPHWANAAYMAEILVDLPDACSQTLIHLEIGPPLKEHEHEMMIEADDLLLALPAKFPRIETVVLLSQKCTLNVPLLCTWLQHWHKLEYAEVHVRPGSVTHADISNEVLRNVQMMHAPHSVAHALRRRLDRLVVSSNNNSRFVLTQLGTDLFVYYEDDVAEQAGDDDDYDANVLC